MIVLKTVGLNMKFEKNKGHGYKRGYLLLLNPSNSIFYLFQIILGYVSLRLQQHKSDIGVVASNSNSLTIPFRQNDGKKVKRKMVAQLMSLVRRIGVLTILGAVVGGQYRGWEGAIIGAVVGWFLDQRFGR